MTISMGYITEESEGQIAPKSDHQEVQTDPEVLIARRIFEDPRNEGQWTSPMSFGIIAWFRNYVLPACDYAEDSTYVLNSYEHGLHHNILSTFIVEDDTSPQLGSVHADLQLLLGYQIVHTTDPHTKACATRCIKTKLTVTRTS